MEDEVVEWKWEGEDWGLLEELLPYGWQEKALELGALRRRRGFSDASSLLRVLLIHLAEGCSLRETAVRAAAEGLAQVSDVTLFNRLRGCGAWFQWIGEELIRQWLPKTDPDTLLARTYRVRVVDGSTVSEPGATGSTWRLHYSTQLPSLSCDEVSLTTKKVGESLSRFQVAPGDILIADRGYSHRSGVRHVQRHGGVVIVRMNLRNMPLNDTKGRPFALLSHLRRLRIGDTGDWVASIEADAGDAAIEGRVCAIKKSRTATQRAREKLRSEAKKKGRKTLPETWEACAYTFVFTTLPAAVPATTVMELYRGRWQVELAFKRLKSLLALGHLKKTDPVGAQAWLQGKLLVAIVIETLIALADRFSPWGYRIRRNVAA
jgi:Transposase DDE domain